MVRATTLILLIALLFSCSSESDENREIIDLIPHSSALVIRVNDVSEIDEARKENLFIRSLSSSPRGNQAEAFLKAAAKTGVQIQKPFWISSNLSGKNQAAWLILQDTKHLPAIDSILRISSSQRLYEATKIHQVEVDGIQLYMARLNGHALIGNDPLIVEESVRLQTSKSKRPEELNEILTTSNRKDPFNLYVQNEFLEDWLKHWLPLDWSGLAQSSGWIGLDGTFPQNALLLSGISTVNDSLGHRLSWFQGNAPQRIRVQQVIPDGTAGVLAFGMGNALQWHRSYEKWLKRTLAYDAYQKNIRDYGQEAQVVDAFVSWMDNEAALFLSELKKEAEGESVFGVFKARDTRLAISSLNPFAETAETYRDLTVYRLKFRNITGTVYGPPFDQLHRPYYTTLGSYLVFGNSLAGLKAVINDWYLGKTLGNQDEFNAFLTEFGNQSHVFAYGQNPAWQSWMQSWAGTMVDSNYSASFRQAGMQIRVDNDLAYTNLLFSRQPEAPVQSRVSWTLSLDTTMIGSPMPITNHYSGRSEILVQDARYTLYHIGTNGQVLWKRKLDGPILGDVQEMDYYRNQKLQFLFNTPQTVYLIDRNGKDVEAYPKTLNRSATAPIALFDYDRNRNYRILIPQGKTTTLWDKTGKEVTGWKFTGTQAPVQAKPVHYQAYGKDFIVLKDTMNGLYILNRSGEIRIPINQKLNLSNNQIYLSLGENLAQSKLVTTSKTGALVYIYLTGSIDLLETEILEPNHEFIQSANGTFVLSGHTLRLESNGSIHRYSFEHDGNQFLKQAKMNGQTYLACLARGAQELYLIDQEGQLVEGFPVFGETNFTLIDLDLDDKPNLIVGGKDGTLYNYALD